MTDQPSVGTATAEASARWDALVDELEPGSLCHRFAWKPVVESTYGLRCEYLIAERGDTLAGVLPLMVVKSLFGGTRLVSLPFLDLGGILARDEQASKALFTAAGELAQALGVQGVDLRGGQAVGTAEGAAETHRFRFLLPLPDDAEELWSKIGGKVRNQIRKSQKSGLVTQREDGEGLEAFYTIFAENMRDLGSPVHSRRLFASILREFGTEAGLYMTRDSTGRAVAGGVAMRSGTTITVPWASSLRAARSSCPNHSLYWKVLQDAVQGSGTVFDFGRSSEGTGTYRFKKQWKAEPVPLAWSSFDPAGEPQAAEQLDPRRNQRLAQTWSRLPLPVANALGPWIRRRLAN